MIPYLYINLTSAICCFFFILTMVFIYFSKKNMNNIENKIFKVMLISNLFATSLGTLLYISIVLNLFNITFLPHYLDRFILNACPLFFIVWFLFLTFYIFIISNENNTEFIKKINNNKKVFFMMLCITIVIGVMHFLEYRDYDPVLGVETAPFVVMCIVIDITMIIDVFLLVKNRKKYNKRKVFPVFITLSIMILSLIIGTMGIPIVFFHLVITSANSIFFQTIENPDLKLVNELTLAKTQVEKASNAKSDFLSSMSHELRTPLNAILGLSQLIETTDDWEEVRSDSKDITNSSKKLLELVNGILEINSIDNNEIELHNNVYNPYDIFNDIERLANNRILDKNIKININVSNDIPSKLFGDKDKIKTIISNLIINAIKYTDEGFVELNASCFIVKDKCNLRISVSDTGKGIKEEDLPYLFDKFYRSDENKDSDIEGTGLGLAITKSLIDLMDGKISVNSTYREGTTFTVTLSQKIKEAEMEEIL